MAVNEDHRQVAIAVETEEAARAFAHSTRAVPVPSDSYQLLAELTRTTDHLQQVARQLSAWHRQVVDGREYAGEDPRGDGVTGPSRRPISSRSPPTRSTTPATPSEPHTAPTASSVGSGSDVPAGVQLEYEFYCLVVGYREEESARISRLYRAAGMIPPSERVWRHGVDITHEPPGTWPWPYSMYVSGARGAALREQYLAWHAEARRQHDDSA